MEWLEMSYKEYLAMAGAALVLIILTTDLTNASLASIAGTFIGIFLLVFGIVAASKWLTEALGLEEESKEESA